MIPELPAVNAVLNTVAALCLGAGWVAIRRRRVRLHLRLMVAALAASALFLASYLVYHFHHPSTPYPRTDWTRPVYYTILVSHIVLAAANVPLVAMTVVRAARGRFAGHKRIARWTLPIWLYVSVTGVLVYLMLYRWS